jgi:preprotein translocase subunit YajC
MSILNLIGITDVLAGTPVAAPQSAGEGMLSMLPMLVIIVVVFYFLFVRPQSKRAKEQRDLLDSLSIGDEVITIGGVAGKITKLRDNFIVINVNENNELTIQKSAISTILPKGTLEAIK